MKTAMILAAGRGERLKPLTESIPKAMCVIGKKPLVAHHVENLAHSNFKHIVINHAYLGGKIRQYLGNGNAFGVDITYSPEPCGGLETGGGIVNALPLLGDYPFITVNADILTDYDFSQLHIHDSRLAHLILTPKNPTVNHPGDFGLMQNHILTNTNRDYTFAGIACYRPELFAGCSIGRYSVTPLLRNKILDERISGEVYSGMWFDIGSFLRLEEARKVFNTTIGKK